MDPITASLAIGGIMSAVGAGGGIFAGITGAGIAAQEAALSQKVAGYQEEEDAQRQLAMQLNERRQETQVMRTAQMQSSQSLAAGVGQTGGTGSSSVQAGVAQGTSGGAYNLSGLSQNLQIGNAIFGLNKQIDIAKIQMAGLQGQEANAQGMASIFQGIGSFGNTLSSGAGGFGKLGQYFGGGGGGTLGVGPMGEPQYS